MVSVCACVIACDHSNNVTSMSLTLPKKGGPGGEANAALAPCYSLAKPQIIQQYHTETIGLLVNSLRKHSKASLLTSLCTIVGQFVVQLHPQCARTSPFVFTTDH